MNWTDLKWFTDSHNALQMAAEVAEYAFTAKDRNLIFAHIHLWSLIPQNPII